MTLDFHLIESILWTPEGGYHLMEDHLDRLAASALHFGFKLDERAVRGELNENAKGLEDAVSRFKVRILLDGDGNLSISSVPIPAQAHLEPLRVTAAPEKTDPSNVFLFHKTTRRELYDRLLAEFSAKGFYDIIFENVRGEITEGAWNNVILKTGGRFFTPPVRCGLLNGVFRRTMLESGKLAERVLTGKDLSEAENIYCCNSVRGLVEVMYEA